MTVVTVLPILPIVTVVTIMQARIAGVVKLTTLRPQRHHFDDTLARGSDCNGCIG